MLGETMRLEAINIGPKRSEAEMLESKFLGASADLAARARVRAARSRVEASANVPGCSWVLGEETISGAVKSAIEKRRGLR